ncbi:hypothetical protein ElyMa_006699900 [Elysia marginata]|uniref:Uncharacterized protein n=1 Tax=Elysia marginata TaxID=1093978 RepID=A0AAV4IQW5_9GAST|nr:hypothetical protein ElyMa_006699900 [Elysia marginata]
MWGRKQQTRSSGRGRWIQSQGSGLFWIYPSCAKKNLADMQGQVSLIDAHNASFSRGSMEKELIRATPSFKDEPQRSKRSGDRLDVHLMICLNTVIMVTMMPRAEGDVLFSHLRL